MNAVTDHQIIHQLSCNYEPNYVELRGPRGSLQAFVKAILATETAKRVRLEPAEASKFFKSRVRQIEIACTDSAIKFSADDDLLRMAGGRESLAMFAHSIRNLASSEQSELGSHMHFEPGADQCMADDSWSVVVELT